MAVYIALLRGVNVGRNSLSMDRVRELWSGLGFRNVATYVQSGNVVFEADGSRSECSSALEQTLAGETRLPVSIVLRTRSEMKAIIGTNPFLKDPIIDSSKLHVTFLASRAAKEAVKKLSGLNAGNDRFHASGTEIYLHCPDGYGRSRLSNNALERLLAVRATTRNWNTVKKLYEIASRS